MTKVLFFGEPLIRITPIDYQSVSNGTLSTLYYGGSEINVACNLQSLGLPTKVLTALPKHDLGNRFLDFLKTRSIDTSAICYIGDRIGTYYTETGFGCRQTEVFYDRKHTSICDIKPDILDIDTLLQDVSHFHFSGITIALGENVRTTLLFILKEAKKRGITISIDLNLRTKLISILDAKKIFSTFAKYADYCFGIEPLMMNEKDLTMFDRENASIAQLQDRMQQLKEIYQFKTIFHTQRSTDENGQHIYKAYALGDTFVESTPMKTTILDRIGSGDAFVSGAIYKLVTESNLVDTLNFGAASASLKCTIYGDNMTKSVSDIEKILATHKDIIR
ncbi:sugar kinase [Granulicatella sp. zg-ZJ]|uniref:sugar kinase n=1 Tax=Granulicatella sp. zg-ZJ TaxID=2678504 RepID=UPI0013D75D0A|nr:sugar kinase [Granulicatella sp. zg-ZJ]NEW63195.1 sugar kinase [Granulicatella sp. zg-ZJ]